MLLSTPAAIQTALRLQSEGKSSLHHELKLKRRIQRECSLRERSRSARSSCSSRSSQLDDSNVQEMEKMEKEKQDLEIENIIQVRCRSFLLSLTIITQWYLSITNLCFSESAGNGESAKGGRGEGEEEAEGGADGAGEATKRGWDGETTPAGWQDLFTVLLKKRFQHPSHWLWSLERWHYKIRA